MRNIYFYEWCVEEWEYYSDDPNDYDIQDHDFADSLKAYCDGLPDNKENMLCLVWHEGNEDEGEIDRAYAYTKIVDGKHCLGDYFLDSSDCKVHRIPRRFHAELERFQK